MVRGTARTTGKIRYRSARQRRRAARQFSGFYPEGCTMTVSKIAKRAAVRKQLEIQAVIRQDAIARLRQVIELMRDIPRLNQGDHEAANDAIGDIKTAILCIQDVNGEA